MKKKAIRSKMISKPLIIACAFFLQLTILLMVVYQLSLHLFGLYTILVVLSYITVIVVLNRDDNPSYQLIWTIVILFIPLFGGILYLLFGGKKIPKALRKEMVLKDSTKPYLDVGKNSLIHSIPTELHRWVKLMMYLETQTYFPLFENTQTKYLPIGEDKFVMMMEALRSAQKFILLEYFIVKDGKMLDSISKILMKKAQDGIEVLFVIDDFGAAELSSKIVNEMKEAGVIIQFFNPLKISLAVFMNNRNHRKICVVDNRVGFVGGINIGDEYINVIERFGHWKDNAIMLEGEAVSSLTVMFLTLYEYVSKQKKDINSYLIPHNLPSQGYVQPFSDSPTDEEAVGENVHLHLINQANRSIKIQTPYLILSHVMRNALILASKSGVKVEIMVPHVPDKRMVFEVTRSYYEPLLKAGVIIAEYVPGFVHAKMMIVDHQVATLGTTNMDYRSYYLHFECGVMVYQDPIINEMSIDFDKTMEECVIITPSMVQSTPWYLRIFRALLRVFATML
jgi:cardiolipin synthase A/B